LEPSTKIANNVWSCVSIAMRQNMPILDTKYEHNNVFFRPITSNRTPDRTTAMSSEIAATTPLM
jgi:hypothetical protein